MGVSTAYHLTKKGVSNVLLLEQEPFFGAGATGRCAGGIRHQFSTEVNIRLSIHSIRMLENFRQEPGGEVDLRQCGYLFMLTTREEMDEFRRNVMLQRRLGVETELLSPEEIATRVPLINLDGIIGGTFYGRDGLADPSGVVQGYVSGARRLGAQLLADVTVTDVLTTSGRVQGVETSRGRVMAPIVVNAAGPWAALVGEMAGVLLPIEPIRRQIVVTAPIPEVPPDFPMVIDFHQSLYFHREGEGILTGQSNPDQPPGFDQSVDPDWTLQHLTVAVARMPILERAGIMRQWAGLYEVTPDDNPILGWVPGLEGFVVVAGFSGHGFMHGPIAGLLMAEEIVDGQARTVDVRSLSIARFWSKRYLQEHGVV